MIFFANCKINLGLQILRKRPDGYHDIATVMVPVPWCDLLEATQAADVSGEDTLTVTGLKIDCPVEKNLAFRALLALRDRKDFPPTDLRLHKIVPDGAGLGGGSSDAAFTIRAVNRLYSLGLSDEEMADIAAVIGSDCPFFIYNRPMLATGTGTVLTPVDLDLSGWHIVIAKPRGVSVSTAAAYAAVTPDANVPALTDLLLEPPENWQGRVVNDFEPGIFAAAPTVARVRDTMLRLGAVYSAMSGSGAAVFGLFRELPAPVMLRTSLYNCDIFTGKPEQTL